jgi:hypothetical protein
MLNGQVYFNVDFHYMIPYTNPSLIKSKNLSSFRTESNQHWKMKMNPCFLRISVTMPCFLNFLIVLSWESYLPKGLQGIWMQHMRVFMSVLFLIVFWVSNQFSAMWSKSKQNASKTVFRLLHSCIEPIQKGMLIPIPTKILPCFSL